MSDAIERPHIVDAHDECVAWCPACGPACEHGENSYECSECKKALAKPPREPVSDALNFRIVKRGPDHILVWDTRGGRPAEDTELALWRLLYGEPEDDDE